MTREKKEIIKKIYEIQDHLDMDIAMGCGCMPSEQIEAVQREQIDPLYERLRVLQHYDSVEAMLHDERGWDF